MLIWNEFTASFTVSFGFPSPSLKYWVCIFCFQNYQSNHRRQPSCTLYMSSAFQMKHHPLGIIVWIVFIQWQQLIFISFISLSKLQSHSCFILRKLLVPRSRCLESSYLYRFLFVSKCYSCLLIFSVIFRNFVICTTDSPPFILKCYFGCVPGNTCSWINASYSISSLGKKMQCFWLTLELNKGEKIKYGRSILLSDSSS